MWLYLEATEGINDLKFFKDGKYLIAGGKKFAIYDLNSAAEIKSFDYPTLSFAVSPDNEYIAVRGCTEFKTDKYSPPKCVVSEIRILKVMLTE